jgi:NAD-dependent SIR2 family protein deacetylase
MPEAKCPRCHQPIRPDGRVAFDQNQILHLECFRPRELNYEERSLLAKFCWSHAVAECHVCGGRYRQQELAADLIVHRIHLCPSCRTDLTASLRAHLTTCPVVPGEVRPSAEKSEPLARRHVRESRDLSSRTDALMREAEAAIDAFRESIRRLAAGGS